MAYKMNPIITALCQIYCDGPILEAVQKANLFPDSKHFVDMALKQAANETLKAFFELGDRQINEHELYRFVYSHFHPPGTELEICAPEDWTLHPHFLTEKLPPSTKNWLFDLHTMWLQLCRQVKPIVKEKQELFSLLYVPNPFIVPGGRFREFYYWDTFWTIKGLLVSSMYSTVRGMIQNLAYMVENYGFIPNGGRVYYIYRTQPPFFIKMVEEYFAATSDLQFVADMMANMEKEFQFWIQNRSVKIVDIWHSFRYKAVMLTPRPESYREDLEITQHITKTELKINMWSQIASGAESGWDFSSRWFSHRPPHAYMMKSIRTWSIIPVDLNAFMCMNAGILADMALKLGDQQKYEKYKKIHAAAKKVLRYVHWNEKDGIWYDYDYDRREQITDYYISNALPIYAKCFDNTDVPNRVFRYMKRVGAFERKRSIPTSFIKSGEQWDEDNSWAPLIQMVIDGFYDYGDSELREAAERFAVNWLLLTYDSYVSTRFMFEKYNASVRVDMPYGGGGEYEVQTGFGWTNGVTMAFLLRYGTTFEKELLNLNK